MILRSKFEHRINFGPAEVTAEVKFDQQKNQVTDILYVGISHEKRDWSVSLRNHCNAEKNVSTSFPMFILDAIPGLTQAVYNHDWTVAAGVINSRVSKLLALGFLKTMEGFYHPGRDVSITDFVVSNADDRNFNFMLKFLIEGLSLDDALKNSL